MSRCGNSCRQGYSLRQTVTVQQAAIPTDGTTTPTLTALYSNVRAEVLPLRGYESRRGDQVEASQAWRVTMRYRSGIDPTCRIVWGSRNLNVTAAYDPNQMGKWIVCECSEVPT